MYTNIFNSGDINIRHMETDVGLKKPWGFEMLDCPPSCLDMCSAHNHSFHASFIYILSYDLILQRTAHVFLESWDVVYEHLAILFEYCWSGLISFYLTRTTEQIEMSDCCFIHTLVLPFTSRHCPLTKGTLALFDSVIVL